MLVVATAAWLLMSHRLDLLLIVVPVSLVISYLSGKAGRVSRNRI